jgi:hypothetical protein
MKYCTLFAALLLALSCGCTFSRGIAYYNPSGAGKTVLDHRQIPTTIEYGFGTGSCDHETVLLMWWIMRGETHWSQATHRLTQANSLGATTPLANIELQ